MKKKELYGKIMGINKFSKTEICKGKRHVCTSTKKKQGAFNMLLIIAIKKYEVPRNKETIKLCKLLSEIS